jgi:Trypsin-co-occurring domain 1
MKNLEKIKLEDGTELLIEVMESSETAVSSITESLGLDVVVQQISALAVKLRQIAEVAKPDETTVEVSVGFTVESGKLAAVVVKGSAEGNIKVSCTWKSAVV